MREQASPDGGERSARTGRARSRRAPAAGPVLLRQRLAVLFLAGLLLWFSPLVLRLEETGTWHGLPVLYLYLFGVWLLLILLAVLVLARGRD
jgi:hypothetical protein